MAHRKALQFFGFASRCTFDVGFKQHAVHRSTLRYFSTNITEPSQDSNFNEHSTQKPSEITPADCAFITRTGLRFSRNETYLQAVTHKSFMHGQMPSNDRLEFLGTKVLGLFATEYVHSKYPNLPPETLRDAVNALTCQSTLNRFGRALGVHIVMRWKPADDEHRGESSLVAKTTTALIGAFYHERGSVAAKRFIHAGILSKQLNMEDLLNLNQPKRLLSALLRRKGLDAPKSRMLNETGRYSATPAYFVGVFSGLKMIGEGFGSSIVMAEHRAAKDALIKYFLQEIGEPLLPSEAESLPEESQLTFIGPPLGDTPPIV